MKPAPTQLAFCDFGITGVLIDVADLVEVMDAHELSPGDAVLDLAELLGEAPPPGRRRALRLAGCEPPAWLLVGEAVRFVERGTLGKQELPPFVAPHLYALWIQELATQGDKLAYRLDARRLRAHFGGAAP
jgi:hypothetical protein